MRTATWLCRVAGLGAFVLALGIAPVAGADEPPAAQIAGQEKADDLGPTPVLPRGPSLIQGVINDVAHGDLQFAALDVGKYTLKLALGGVPKPLDAQLKLGGEGALVISVVKGGPAEKAGLKPHDILISVEGETIKKIVDVIKVVNESDGKELRFKVLRGGEPITVTITPEAPHFHVDYKVVREYQKAAEEAAREGEKAARDAMRKVHEIEEDIRAKLKDAGVDVRLQVIEPGRFVPQAPAFSTEEEEEFPDGLKINIRKESKEPAKIEVTRGDESWSVTEDKLDELPKDVRGHVKKLLGRAGPRYSISLPRKVTVPVPVLTKEAQKRARAAAEQARERAREAAEVARGRAAEMRERYQHRLERQLDEMTRQMSHLREQMDELRRGLHEEQEEVEERAAPNDERGDDDEDKQEEEESESEA